MEMRLLLKQDMMRNVGNTLRLSDLELEKILEEGLENVKEFYRENQEHARKGNYFLSKLFYDKVRDVKGRIPEQAYATNPVVIVSRDGEGYASVYNTQLNERIKRSLE